MNENLTHTWISTSDSVNTTEPTSHDIILEKEIELSNNIAKAISQLLYEIVQENKKKGSVPQIDSFYSKKIPNLSLEDYLKRIIKYSQIEPSTLILSVIYIDKICENKNYILCVNNIHRFLLASILIAIKFNEDDFYKNTQYAKIGGIPLDEINKLEYEFYNLIDFSIFVNNALYQKYENYFYQLIK